MSHYYFFLYYYFKYVINTELPICYKLTYILQYQIKLKKAQHDNTLTYGITMTNDAISSIKVNMSALVMKMEQQRHYTKHKVKRI